MERGLALGSQSHGMINILKVSWVGLNLQLASLIRIALARPLADMQAALLRRTELLFQQIKTIISLARTNPSALCERGNNAPRIQFNRRKLIFEYSKERPPALGCGLNGNTRNEHHLPRS